VIDEFEPAFTAMTFNVGNGLIVPERLTALLRASAADLIGLQEVDMRQAEALTWVADAYPYQAIRGTGFSGRALLSRYPILDVEWLHFSDARPDLRTVVRLFDTRITVLVAHPRPPRPGRHGVIFDSETLNQIERLVGLAASSAPAVLLGDFNLTPRHPAHARLLASGLVDAFLTAGSGHGSTFPLRPGRTRWGSLPFAWLPLPSFARIDYIWHTPDLVTRRAWVGSRGGSDHRPVLARLLLPATDPGGGMLT
jgi:endonuclease/exonuclease/phosphatase (EEP) superfamily protein YafD